MTVRDLLELVSEKRTVKIKPNGRRVYYMGSATEVPEGLMGCEVTELAPITDDEDNLVLGVWVTADMDWGLMVDCFGTADDATAPIYDGAYYQLIEDREKQEQEAQKIIQTNREKRKDRYWEICGQKKPYGFKWDLGNASEWEAEIKDVLDAEHLEPIPDELFIVDECKEK